MDQNLELFIDNESVEITRRENENSEGLHIVYWHIDEWAEDPSVVIPILKAIELFYTDQKKLLRVLGLEKYIL